MQRGIERISPLDHLEVNAGIIVTREPQIADLALLFGEVESLRGTAGTVKFFHFRLRFHLMEHPQVKVVGF